MVNQKKIVSYTKAVDIVNEETNLKELLLEIKKRKSDGFTYGNPHFHEVKSPIGERKQDSKKRMKRKIVCPFHETKNDDSTSILEGQVDMISCFRGGCVANKAITPITAYMILELDVNPKIIGTKAANSKFGLAVYRLANRLGYTIQDEKIRQTPAQKAAMKKAEILLKTTEIYHQEFLESKEAQHYFLEERGFKYGVVDPWEIIKKYKVGFAPKEFPSTFLYDKLAPDYTTEEILDTSVVKWIQFKNQGDGGVDERALDFHSHALTFSYWDAKFRNVTNIYSRGLTAEKKFRHLRLVGTVDEPINFGPASQHEEVMLVEGEITLYSVLALAHENAMGNRGTQGLADEHIDLLVKAREESNGQFCKRIIICFDGDEPGRKATIATGEALLEKGFDVRVMILAEGEDPNDILTKRKENAKSYFDKLKAEAVSYYTFLALSQITDNKYDTAANLKEFHQVRETLAKHNIVNPFELQIIAKEISERKKIPFEIVWSTWQKTNKEIEVFTNQRFAFMTNNYDAFVLTRHVFPGKTTYVEDTTFSFLKEKPIVRNLVIDEVSYDEEEKVLIANFCNEHDIRIFAISDFDKIIDMDPKQLMNQLLKG